MMPSEIVQSYLDKNFRIVVWPHIGDSKGPREPDWPKKIYTIQDYKEGNRVGILTGVEVSPGKFLHDIDIDWSPGAEIAGRLLPGTSFVFGRSSKRISHCFYLLPEALPSFRYEDIDKTCLIELRGTKLNGELGFQTMVPPSEWSKEDKREKLEFIKYESPAFIESINNFKQSVCLSAIGMILAKNLGKNGFGHEAQLSWAGFLLRAGIPSEDIIKMGEGMCPVTNHTDPRDIRAVVQSTANRLNNEGQKIKGGPALAKALGRNGKAIINKINEWIGKDSDFIRSSEGNIIKDSQDNIRRAIQLFDIELSKNEFAEKILVKEADRPPKLIDDDFVIDTWLRIDRDYHFRPSFEFFDKVVKNTATSNCFHPVRDYLSTLKWDGISRINTWLIDYGGAVDSSYVQAVSAIVLIAGVKRILQPGCKYDEMLVLESPQGMNKSSALRALCPNPEWFSDDFPLNTDSKQLIECTLGKWIIEASDLTGGRKADRDHLKSMLSRQVDGPARMAYARNPIERARQFIIIGSTNSATYLADMTGARRIWPVKVKRFNIEGVIEHRDQLWAEASVRESQGESIRLPESLWGAAGQEQESRREVDAWEHVIEEHLPLLRPAGDGRKRVTTAKLWDILGISIANRDRPAAMRISEIMQRFGFERTKIWDEGRTQAGYIGPVEDLPLDKAE